MNADLSRPAERLPALLEELPILFRDCRRGRLLGLSGAGAAP